MFKKIFENKKLITFDLDGTTVQSEKVWDLAFREVGKLINVDPNSTGICGDTIADRWGHIIEKNYLKDTKPMPELVDLTQKEFLKNLDKLDVTDGLWFFLPELKLIKKYHLALVTNTSRMVTDLVLTHLELNGIFDFVICGDEVKRTKPDPEIYKKTLEHFKCSANETLAFEDSLTGCTAAAKAGIKIICVWDGLTPQRRFPDEVLEYTTDFVPFPGTLDTTGMEDIEKMAKELASAQPTAKI